MSLTGHSGAVHSVSYSSDGRLLASGSADGTVRIWDTQVGEETLSPMRSGDGPVFSVDFAQTSKQVTFGTEAGVVYVWNIAQGQSHLRLSGHSSPAYSVAFSLDGNRLVSASKDTALLWNPQTGEQLAVLNGHAESVDSVAFAPNGIILAFSSRSGLIGFWHSITGQVAREPQRVHPPGIYASPTTIPHGVDFSPCGEMIAVIISHHNCVVIQRFENEKEIARLQGATKMRSARFSSDGRSLVAAHGRDIRLWTLHPDPAKAPCIDLSGHTGNVNWATFSPDNRYVASASDDGTIRIWNAASSQSAVQTLPAHTKPISSIAVSRDGSFIVSGSEDKSARVWNACTGEEKCPPLVGHTYRVNSVAVSPDVCLIASASRDNTVRLWDAQLGVAIGNPMRGHTDNVMAVTFSNDGRWLASASDDYNVCLWDVTTRQLLDVGPLCCERAARAVSFSLNDKLVAAGDTRGHIYLWQTDTGEQAREPFQTNQTIVWSLAFSPDGGRIVSGGSGEVARIWDLSTGQAILELQGNSSLVLSVAWSVDGRLIGTGFNDNTVRLWDASTGAPLTTLDGHKSTVSSVTFTPDSRSIFSVSKDHTIRKWNVPAACRSASESSNDPVEAFASATLKDGWLMTSSDEFLLWVPVEYRDYLQAGICTLLIGGSRVIATAGDTGLHVGTDWTMCWRD